MGRKGRWDGVGDTRGGTVGIMGAGTGGFSSWDESPPRGGDCGTLIFPFMSLEVLERERERERRFFVLWEGDIGLSSSSVSISSSVSAVFSAGSGWLSSKVLCSSDWFSDSWLSC